MRLRRRASCLLLVLSFATCIAVAADSPADPCTTTVNQPGDISLQLRLENGQSVFREGEIIGLVADYSSSTPNKYSLSTANYDRSGRLDGIEVFCLSPDTSTDPLYDYFHGGMAFIGGGLRGSHSLDSSPYSVNLQLNEWRSLAPGSYQLRIIGRRACVQSGGNSFCIKEPPLLLESNKVEFQVVKADPEWEAAQIAEAKHALDSADPKGDEARRGARILRFLGSEASTRELARRFWSSNDQPFGWDLKFGLYGSPYRQLAIESMRAALTDPQHPVTQEFVQNLVQLEMDSNAETKLPPYDEKNKDAWAKARDAHFAEYNKRIADYMAQAGSALHNKTGKARAVTVDELLQSQAPLNDATRTQLRQMLVASWDSLPPRQQNELIEFRWEQIGGPELLLILKRIVAGPANPNRQIDEPNRGPALQHLYELAPADGRDFMLHEIASPKGDIGISVLGLLPERELPQIEPGLATKLTSSSAKDVDYQLIQRYASRGLLPVVQQTYEAHRGEWACAPQTAMLRYFLRVNPEYGIAQVSDALTYRKSTGCYSMQLTGLEDDIRQPKLQRIAIQALNDPSPQLAQDAAQALQKYGSAEAQPALWARLEKFHEKWKGRADELHFRPGMDQESMAERRLEQVLTQAITSAQAWTVDEPAVERLKELTSSEEQQELDGVLAEIRRGECSVNLSWWPDGQLNYNVCRLSGKGMAGLKEKLSQFPAGTHISLVTTAAVKEHHQAEFAEIESTASAHGLALEVQTPR